MIKIKPFYSTAVLRVLFDFDQNKNYSATDSCFSTLVP